MPTIKTSSGSIRYLTNPWATARDKLSILMGNGVGGGGGKDSTGSPDHPDSELDSGISVNGNYDQIDQARNRKNAALSGIGSQGDYERIEEIRTLQSKTQLTSGFFPPIFVLHQEMDLLDS